MTHVNQWYLVHPHRYEMELAGTNSDNDLHLIVYRGASGRWTWKQCDADTLETLDSGTAPTVAAAKRAALQQDI